MSFWMMLLFAAVPPSDQDTPNSEGQSPPVSCDDWPVDHTITLPADRQGLAAALFALNRGGAMREFSAEKAAAPALAHSILADGRIDAAEQDVLCEMTHPQRRGRVALTVGGESQGSIWAHSGYTEDILRDALNGKVPTDALKQRQSQ